MGSRRGNGRDARVTILAQNKKKGVCTLGLVEPCFFCLEGANSVYIYFIFFRFDLFKN